MYRAESPTPSKLPRTVPIWLLDYAYSSLELEVGSYIAGSYYRKSWGSSPPTSLRLRSWHQHSPRSRSRDTMPWGTLSGAQCLIIGFFGAPQSCVHHLVQYLPCLICLSPPRLQEMSGADLITKVGTKQLVEVILSIPNPSDKDRLHQTIQAEPA